MTSQTLVGKAVLVTGGARRIGREIALELASAGADVTITYRNSKDEAEQTLQLIKQLGRLAIALECDVRSEQSVRSAISASVNFHGHLDVLVNNAAIYEVCAARHVEPRSVGRRLRNQCARTVSRRPRGSAASARRLMAASSTSARSADCALGPAMPTTAHPRPPSTCLPRPWPRPSHLR